MPLYEFTHCQRKVEVLRRSFEDAKSRPEKCPDCGLPMKLLPVLRVSFMEFKPFRTQAFSKDGSEIEVRDRNHLRRLLSQNKMVERGDRNTYFGSDPRSIPTLEEIARHGEGGISEKTRKMLDAGMVGAVDAKDWKDMRLEDKKTNSGRKDKLRMTERDRKKIYELKNKGGIVLAGR